MRNLQWLSHSHTSSQLFLYTKLIRLQMLLPFILSNPSRKGEHVTDRSGNNVWYDSYDMPCDETGILCEYNWSLHGDEIHLLFLLELYLILAWFQSLMPDIPYTGLSSRLDINSGSRESSERLSKNRDSEIELYR